MSHGAPMNESCHVYEWVLPGVCVLVLWLGVAMAPGVLPQAGTNSQSQLHSHFIQCNTLRYTAAVATHCNTLQHIATHCNALQYTATQAYLPQYEKKQTEPTHCNTLQHTATYCNILQHKPTCLNMRRKRRSQRTATHCNTLQHTATHCNTSLPASIWEEEDEANASQRALSWEKLFLKTSALQSLYIANRTFCECLYIVDGRSHVSKRQLCSHSKYQVSRYLHRISSIVDYGSLLQNIVSFIGLFCKRDL